MGVKVKEKIKGSGEYWIFINHHGRRKSKKIGRDKKMASEVAKKIEARLALGDFGMSPGKDSENPVFKEYSEIWLQQYVKGVRRISTFERYGDALKRYVYPTIGSKRLDEINRGDVRNLLLKLHSNGLSKSMIRIVHATISGPMAYALDEELITANPVTGLTKRLQLKKSKLEIQPMTPEEVRTFLEASGKHFPEYYAFFLCAFRTGMRLGELCGLKWSDIDWQSKFIEVKRSYKIGRFGPTKTGRSRRVDMSDQLVSVLRDLYRKQNIRTIPLEGIDENQQGIDIVFQKYGKPYEQNFIRKVFKAALKTAGLREMRVHDARHTYASLLLSAGASPVYVKEQLGHTSIQMTVDIYGHLIPSSNRGAVNGLDNHQNTPQAHPQKVEKA